MGMVARVRQRIRANSLTTDREKTAQSVCLLSAVLLLPYCPRGPTPLLPSPASILYAVLVLPVILSANYRYPVSTFKTARRFIIQGSRQGFCKPIADMLERIYRPVQRAEELFLRMKNISAMVNQIVFLALADRLLLPQQRMTCLYTLMFYNVTAYCVSYVKELIEKEDWPPRPVTLTERSNIKHLAMSATKIVLEWTKAVTFVVTLTFILLVFGIEQGLEHYKPSLIYTAVTWTYYTATEKVFVEIFPLILAYFRLETLENMENLYAPVILKSFTILVSALFILMIAPNASWKFLLTVGYLNVYLSSKELIRRPAAALRREQKVLAQYRKATRQEIQRFDDVCAVCLSSMYKARVTPCHHLFHADCLRQCLKTSSNCPMCKRELKVS